MIPLLAALFSVISFVLLYNTSSRAEVPDSFIRNFARRYRMLTKIFSVILLAASFIIFSSQYGTGAGFFIAFIMIMTIASVVILFGPFVRNTK